MTWLQGVEIAGSLTGIIAIYANTQQKAWGWLVGMISIIAYLIIFWEVYLFADFFLHGIYLTMSMYGWYHWLYGNQDLQKNSSVLLVSQVKISETIILLLAGIFGTMAGGYLMQNHLESNTFPYADAFISSFSLVGTWLTAQKKLESWLVWIIVDIVCVYLYYHKQLYLTAGLYGIYTVLAVYGYRAWSQDMLAYRDKNL